MHEPCTVNDEVRNKYSMTIWCDLFFNSKYIYLCMPHTLTILKNIEGSVLKGEYFTNRTHYLLVVASVSDIGCPPPLNVVCVLALSWCENVI